jgi:hypothetical protein
MTLEDLLQAKREEILKVCASTARTTCMSSVPSSVGKPMNRATLT